MTTRLLLFVTMTAPLWGQGGFGGPVNREAPVTPVPFDRILRANQEPQNWLTYSGNLNSQRHSQLTQISPANARDLTLKWVYQSRSLQHLDVLAEAGERHPERSGGVGNAGSPPGLRLLHQGGFRRVAPGCFFGKVGADVAMPVAKGKRR